MCQREFSTDHGIYYNHLRKSHEKGGGVVEVPFILPGWECEQLRVFKGSITGGVLKSLKATILEGKDKNFPEELLDLIGFFRLLRLSLRAPEPYSIYPSYSGFEYIPHW